MRENIIIKKSIRGCNKPIDLGIPENFIKNNIVKKKNPYTRHENKSDFKETIDTNLKTFPYNPEIKKTAC